MLKYRVGKSETCHYKTIQEAINAVPYNTSAEIFIEAGIYKEKIFCEKSDLTIIGENCKNTIITFSDGAKFKDADGDNINTFRSYTAFFGGENIRVENLSIFNEAGESKTAGQSLAVYADAKNVTFKNVYMKSCQDTLFLAPMPEKERITGGFKGPREYVPRFLTKQTYISCKIEGDIDFIFGGADTVFYECDIVSVGESGYVTAPSGKEDGLGLVFYKCRFLSNSEKHSHYLGRPWRKFGKTTLIDCFVGEHIKPEGWDFWNEEENKNTCFFAEYNCNYPKNYTKNRVSWAKELTDSELNYIMSEIEKHIAEKPRTHDRSFTVLLIGGASGTGKSTLAYELGKFYGINVLEVDDIYLTAERSEIANWQDVSVEENVNWLVDMSKELSPALKAIVERHIEDNVPIIIEGDFICTEMVKSFKNPEVKAIFVSESDKQQIIENYFSREGGNLQEFRAEISVSYGSHIKEQGVKTIEARPFNTALNRTIEMIGRG